MGAHIASCNVVAAVLLLLPVALCCWASQQAVAPMRSRPHACAASSRCRHDALPCCCRRRPAATASLVLSRRLQPSVFSNTGQRAGARMCRVAVCTCMSLRRCAQHSLVAHSNACLCRARNARRCLAGPSPLRLSCSMSPPSTSSPHALRTWTVRDMLLAFVRVVRDRGSCGDVAALPHCCGPRRTWSSAGAKGAHAGSEA